MTSRLALDIDVNHRRSARNSWFRASRCAARRPDREWPRGAEFHGAAIAGRFPAPLSTLAREECGRVPANRQRRGGSPRFRAAPAESAGCVWRRGAGLAHCPVLSSMPRCVGTPSSCHRGNHRFQHPDCRVGMLQSVSLLRLLIELISRAASVRSPWLAMTHPARVPTCHRAPALIGTATAPSACTWRSQSQ